MIELNAKGFYFFDWEIKLLKEIGFKLPFLKKKSMYVFRVLKNPDPIINTARREKLMKELRLKMNAIDVQDRLSVSSQPS
jgi:hypothetical protein